MSDLDLIPLSALQHWQYCPRQCGLKRVMSLFETAVTTIRPAALPGAD